MLVRLVRAITNKKGRLLLLPCPLLSQAVSHFSSVGQRRWRVSKAWPTFPALTQNGNELNLFLCERLSDFN